MLMRSHSTHHNKVDSDGDGFGDNERGSGADKFPDDATQWARY